MKRLLDSWEFWVTAAFFALVVIGATGSYVLVHRSEEKLTRVALSSCERGNVIRAEINARGEALRMWAIAEGYPELVAAYKSIRLVDCERAVREGL